MPSAWAQPPTPTRRAALGSLASTENKTAASSPAPRGSARKAPLLTTGKGRLPKSPGNSLFKQKKALSPRGAPVHSAKRTRSGAVAPALSAQAHQPPPAALITPGAIRMQRGSSVLEASRHGSSLVASEPSFETSIANVSTILSNNSTLTAGGDTQRDSLDSARVSMSSARLSVSNSTILSELSEASRKSLGPNENSRDSLAQSDSTSMEERAKELENENKSLRLQIDKLVADSQTHQKRLSFGSEPEPRVAAQPSQEASDTAQERGCFTFGYGDEHVQELEFNCARLKDQDEQLTAAQQQLRTSVQDREKLQTDSPVVVSIKGDDGLERVRGCDKAAIKASLQLLQGDLQRERSTRLSVEAERDDLQQELQDTKRRLTKAHDSDREVQMQLQTAQKTISNLTKDVEDFRRETLDAEQQIAALELEVEDAKRQSCRSEETRRQLETQLQSAQGSISLLSRELDEVKSRAAQAEQDKATLQEKMEAAEQELQHTFRQQRKANEMQNEFETQLQSAQKTISDLKRQLNEDKKMHEAQIAELTDALEHTRVLADQQQQDLDAAQQGRRLVVENNEALEAQVEDLQSKLGAADDSCQALQAQMQHAQQQLESAKQDQELQYHGAQTTLSDLRREVDEARAACEAAEQRADARYDDLKELQAASKLEIDELNDQLLEMQQEHEASRQHRKQQIATLEAHEEELEAQIVTLQKDLLDAKEALASSEHRVADYEGKQNRAADAYLALEAQLREAQTVISSLTKQVDEAKMQISEQDKVMSLAQQSADETLETQKAHIQRLQTQLSDAELVISDAERMQGKNHEAQVSLQEQVQAAHATISNLTKELDSGRQQHQQVNQDLHALEQELFRTTEKISAHVRENAELVAEKQRIEEKLRTRSEQLRTAQRHGHHQQVNLLTMVQNLQAEASQIAQEVPSVHARCVEKMQAALEQQQSEAQRKMLAADVLHSTLQATLDGALQDMSDMAADHADAMRKTQDKAAKKDLTIRHLEAVLDEMTETFEAYENGMRETQKSLACADKAAEGLKTQHQAALAGMEAMLASKQEELSRMHDDAEQRAWDIEALRQQLADKESELRAFKDAASHSEEQMASTRRQLEKEVAEIGFREEELQGQVSILRVELQELHSQCADLRLAAQQNEIEVRSKEHQIQTMNDEFKLEAARLTGLVNSMESELKELSTHSTAASKRMETEISQMDAVCSFVSIQLADLEVLHGKTLHGMQQHHAKTAGLSASLAGAQHELGQLHATRKDLQAQLAQQHSDSVAAQAKADAQLQQVRAEMLQGTKALHCDLQRLHAEIEHELVVKEAEVEALGEERDAAQRKVHAMQDALDAAHTQQAAALWSHDKTCSDMTQRMAEQSEEHVREMAQKEREAQMLQKQLADALVSVNALSEDADRIQHSQTEEMQAVQEALRKAEEDAAEKARGMATLEDHTQALEEQLATRDEELLAEQQRLAEARLAVEEANSDLASCRTKIDTLETALTDAQRLQCTVASELASTQEELQETKSRWLDETKALSSLAFGWEAEADARKAEALACQEQLVVVTDSAQVSQQLLCQVQAELLAAKMKLDSHFGDLRVEFGWHVRRLQSEVLVLEDGLADASNALDGVLVSLHTRKEALAVAMQERDGLQKELTTIKQALVEANESLAKEKEARVDDRRTADAYLAQRQQQFDAHLAALEEEGLARKQAGAEREQERAFKIQAVQEALRKAEEDAAEKARGMATLEDHTQALEEQLATRDEELLAEQQRLAEARLAVEEANSDLASCRTKIDTLETEMTVWRAKFDEADASMMVMHKDIHVRDASIHALDSRLQQAIQEAQQDKRTISDMQEMLHEKEADIAALREVLAERASLWDKLKAEETAQQLVVKERNHEVARLQEQVTRLHDDLEEEQDARNDLTALMQALEDKLAVAEHHIVEMEGEAERHLVQLEEFERTLAEQQDQQQDQVESLREEVADWEWYSTTLQQQVADHMLEADQMCQDHCLVQARHIDEHRQALIRHEAELSAAEQVRDEVELLLKCRHDDVEALNQQLVSCELRLQTSERHAQGLQHELNRLEQEAELVPQLRRMVAGLTQQRDELKCEVGLFQKMRHASILSSREPDKAIDPCSPASAAERRSKMRKEARLDIR